MALQFIGRHKELKALKNSLTSHSGTLAVIKGRRRIGKSRLVEEFAKDMPFLRFSGLAPVTQINAQSQRDAFSQQLSQQLNLEPIKFIDWANLFAFLDKHLPSKTQIILFDEISWMGSKDPTFLPKLKNAWDLFFSKRPNFILILCGSVSTWIEKNVLNSTAFFGRVGLALTLEELSLKESHAFLKAIGFRTSPAEILRLLAVVGGVPWYLERLNPHLTADENIKSLCFLKSGILVEEFERIFNDLFSQKGTIYKEIIDVLSGKDLTLKDLKKEINYAHSGTLTDRMKQLIISGFVSQYQNWKIKQEKLGKQALYHLSDPYLRFYVKYIQPHLPQIQNNSFEFKHLPDLPQWSTIMGLQLETLLLKNRPFIWELLNIHPQDVVWDNPYSQKSNKNQKGLKIDYLIQTRQNVLYLCEIKFSRQPLGLNLKEEIKKKIKDLNVPKGFAICPILIHTSSITDELMDSRFFFRHIDLIKELENQEII